MLSGRTGPPEHRPDVRFCPAAQRDRALRLGVRRAGWAAGSGRARVARSRRPVRLGADGSGAGRRHSDGRRSRRRRSLVCAGPISGKPSARDPVSILAGSGLVHPGCQAAGAFLWAATWITLGYVGAEGIGLIATPAARLGTPIVIVVAAVLIAYLVLKYVRRRRFLRHLRQARITPVELKRRLDAGDHLVIIDLRTALDMEAAPYGIPGACRITPEALQHPHQLIPRDREVVFYCAEPKEATSARLALRLASNGFKSIHPLSGGLEGWREAGFVVVPLAHCSVTPA